jgi:hypothetical protein
MAPVRTLGAVYTFADLSLPLGTQVKDYLAEATVGAGDTAAVHG